MVSPDPMLPLPVAVLKRLETAETLRAELAGVTAERDTLREELQTAAWERDTAQTEAAYLREDVLGRDRVWADEVRKPVGLVLTSGDEPPPPPEDGRSDVALVSLSDGSVRVRSPYRPDMWAEYGEGLSSSDFATLSERGPWITVDGFAYRDHAKRVESRRHLRDTMMHSDPGLARYPAAAADTVQALTDAARRRGLDDDDSIAARFGAVHMLLGVVRREWELADARAERATKALAATPHEPDWIGTADPDVRRCRLCDVLEPDHLTREVATS